MNSHVLAIDPGSSESALILWDGKRVLESDFLINEELLRHARVSFNKDFPVAIEMIASYGMAVGKEVFETCVLIGRLVEIFSSRGFNVSLVFRKDVKIYHCHSMRAKDSNIRQALIDKYGAQGTKKNPGPLYGVKSHLWAALAIATYLTERKDGAICPTPWGTPAGND